MVGCTTLHGDNQPWHECRNLLAILDQLDTWAVQKVSCRARGAKGTKGCKLQELQEVCGRLDTTWVRSGSICGWQSWAWATGNHLMIKYMETQPIHAHTTKSRPSKLLLCFNANLLDHNALRMRGTCQKECWFLPTKIRNQQLQNISAVEIAAPPKGLHLYLVPKLAFL